MSLPNIFSKKKSRSNDLFITLLITSNSVSSALWRVQGQKISILNQSKVRSYQDDDDQLAQCDESLQDLGKESEATDQVLFALEPDWASQTEINPDKDARLQELCKDLSLKAVGFVLITEAFNSHLLQENPLRSSLVLYVGASSLYLGVIIQGIITTSLAVGRSDNLAQDVTEALARLNQEVTSSGARLPLIINLASASVTQSEINQYQQQLFAINWVEKFGFAQTPFVETTSVDDLLELVVRHGGLAVAQDQGLIEVGQLGGDMAEQPAESAVILNQDEVALLPKTALLSQENQIDSKLPTSFGIPINPNYQAGTFSQDESLTNVSLVTADIKETHPKKSMSRLLSWFSKKKSQPLSNQSKSPPSHDVTKNVARLTRHSPKKIKTIIVGGVILGVLVSGISLYLLLSRSYQAVVSIKPDIQLLDKEVTITLDTDIDQSLPAEGLLKAHKVYQEVTEKETVSTTGVKLVGEKAQGQARIINKTESAKTFSQDTVFYSGSLEFSLDEEVTVPAATIELNSSGDGEKKNYGQKEVKLTAREIGSDSNIGKDQTLKIDSFGDDTYSAKTVSEFKGGSSREIRVVAEADLKELLVSLKPKLIRRASEEMTKTNDGQQVIPTETFSIEVEQYSAKIGDEEETVSLELTLKLTGLAYTSQDLLEFAKVVLTENKSDQYEFIDERPDLLSKLPDASNQKNADNQVQLEAKISGRVKAKIDTNQVAQSLINVEVGQAQDQLKNNKLIAASGVHFSPKFAEWFFPKFPSSASRIIIQLEE